jgi:hypothetical protein
VAKLVRHLILDQAIPGSSPGSSAKKKDMASNTMSFFCPLIMRKRPHPSINDPFASLKIISADHRASYPAYQKNFKRLPVEAVNQISGQLSGCDQNIGHSTSENAIKNLT